jgi:hypothetical protein
MFGNIINNTYQNLTHLLRSKNFGVNVNIDNFIALHGDEKINSLVVVRFVFTNKIIMDSIDSISPNWKRKNKYDKLYHTYLVINGKYKLNKNQVLKITNFTGYERDSDHINIPINRYISIFDLLNNTKKFIGVYKMVHYSVVFSNCQDFVIEVLKSNNLLTLSLQEFIKQKTNENITDDLRKTANTFSDIARVIDPVIGDLYYMNPLDLTPFKIQE